MDSVKLGDQGTVGILDPTCVNQASYTISLNKNSEMHKDMSQKDFDEQVKEMSSKARTKVSLYITHAIKVFPSMTFIVNSSLMLLHLETVPGCTLLSS
jgi:hypothetical protein